MKINVDFDCTPQEARALMGLPDLTPLHDQYIERMREVMTTGITPDMVQQLVKSWSPMGDAGMNFWRGIFERGDGKSE